MSTGFDAEGLAWPNLSAATSTAPSGVTIGIGVTSLDDDRSFAHGGTTVFPAASTIKVLILVALARAVDEHRLSLDHLAASGPGTKVIGSGVLNWLHDGLTLPLRDHAWLMIAVSDNTASNVMIDAVGMDAIDAAGRDLGLTGTALNRRFLGRKPDPGKPENHTTANDLVSLLTAIRNNHAASSGQCAWMMQVLGDQQYRNRIPRFLPESISYAGKTGSLEGVAHDCGVVTGPGGSAAVAVLTEGFVDPYQAEAFTGAIARAAIDDLELGS